MIVPRGPVMLDIADLAPTAEERERLAHPLVGAVILFARNYESPAQLRELTASLRALRSPPLLIAVDHEGGRVQRFRDGFTAVAPMRRLGELWDVDIAAAAREATQTGWTIASELRAHGVDFSFAPVLDLDYGTSAVIGDRALHRNPNAVAHLGAALIEGLHVGGMPSVGKHFPGHGFVSADSHVEVPLDERSMDTIVADDLVPFAALAARGLDAIMPAHVIYRDIDELPAGFSRKWLREILRDRLRFDGAVFSDDLSMAGAGGAGDVVGRADAAAQAGCDMVLVCNDAVAAATLLDRWRPRASAELAARLARMEGRATQQRPG
jgi:beta-N-acetylhexosaminidase